MHVPALRANGAKGEGERGIINVYLIFIPDLELQTRLIPAGPMQAGNALGILNAPGKKEGNLNWPAEEICLEWISVIPSLNSFWVPFGSLPRHSPESNGMSQSRLCLRVINTFPYDRTRYHMTQPTFSHYVPAYMHMCQISTVLLIYTFVYSRREYAFKSTYLRTVSGGTVHPEWQKPFFDVTLFCDPYRRTHT